MKKTSILLIIIVVITLFFPKLNIASFNQSNPQKIAKKLKQKIKKDVQVVIDLLKKAGLGDDFNKLLALEKEQFSDYIMYQDLQDQLFDAGVQLCLKKRDPVIIEKIELLEKQRSALRSERFKIESAIEHAISPYSTKKLNLLKTNEQNVGMLQGDQKRDHVFKEDNALLEVQNNAIVQQMREQLNQIETKSLKLIKQQEDLFASDLNRMRNLINELKSYQTTLSDKKIALIQHMKNKLIDDIKETVANTNPDLANRIIKQLRNVVQNKDLFSGCYLQMPDLVTSIIFHLGNII